MTDSAQTQLARLLGARLTGLGRAASLQHFTFIDSANRVVHLHTECAWRLTDAAGIVAGRADYWRPATPETSDEALDAGEIGATLRDVRNEAVRLHISAEAPVVTAVSADRLGGISVDFSTGLRLEVFPDASTTEHDALELWRLFERDHPHFVVDSSGGSFHA